MISTNIGDITDFEGLEFEITIDTIEPAQKRNVCVYFAKLILKLDITRQLATVTFNKLCVCLICVIFSPARNQQK